jgi:MerR family transcriptional regulator, mercuric resistance operon regulatory protein
MALGAEMHIGDLSRQTGCNVETIRYYECIGLLPRPPRSGARYRLYDLADVRRLTFVRRARELGFTLDGFAPAAAARRRESADSGHS